MWLHMEMEESGICFMAFNEWRDWNYAWHGMVWEGWIS
jgi:hypothetical protein